MVTGDRANVTKGWGGRCALVLWAASAVLGVVSCGGGGGGGGGETPRPPEARAPASPGNLRATANEHNRVALQWNEVAGEDGYRVMRATGAGAFVGVGGDLAAGTTTYTDMAVVAVTGYRYRVVAFNSVGPSSPSNVIAVTTRAAPPTRPPEAPGNLRATANEHNRVALQWNEVAGEDGYRVMRATGAGAFVGVGGDLTGGTTAYADTTVVAETGYRYRVVAFNSVGPSPSSNAIAVTTSAPPTNAPEAPGNLRATVSEHNRVALQWNDVAGADGYLVTRATGAGAFEQVSVDLMVGMTTYTDRLVAVATEYRYRVIAFNAVGPSPPSNVITVTTMAASLPLARLSVSSTRIGENGGVSTITVALSNKPSTLVVVALSVSGVDAAIYRLDRRRLTIDTASRALRRHLRRSRMRTTMTKRRSSI